MRGFEAHHCRSFYILKQQAKITKQISAKAIRKDTLQNESLRSRTEIDLDRLAEWLRRWTAKSTQSPCVGSNHMPVLIFFSNRSDKRKVHKNYYSQKQSEKIQCRINHTPRTADDCDMVVKWLRRWTSNPKQYPCVGSNPNHVGIFSNGSSKRRFQK